MIKRHVTRNCKNCNYGCVITVSLSVCKVSTCFFALARYGTGFRLSELGPHVGDHHSASLLLISLAAECKTRLLPLGLLTFILPFQLHTQCRPLTLHTTIQYTFNLKTCTLYMICSIDLFGKPFSRKHSCTYALGALYLVEPERWVCFCVSVGG